MTAASKRKGSEDAERMRQIIRQFKKTERIVSRWPKWKREILNEWCSSTSQR